MTRQRPDDPPKADEWRNLRDDKGRLYGRVNRVKMILEIRSHRQTVTFDLKVLLETRQNDPKEVK